MKRIAVLTSGGDAPGMNAAIRAVVRVGIELKMEVFGVNHGYAGLVGGSFVQLRARDVSGILGIGGSFLQSARCPEFKTEEGQMKALHVLRENGIDGIVIIGGNGSQAGSYALSRRGFPVVGIASTIDNDLYGSEITIGVDTALNVILEAIDRLKVTASSHERAFVIEVMGRNCGYLALMAGIAGGAEAVIIPEVETHPEAVADEIRSAYERGKNHALVVVAEGSKYNATKLEAYFKENHERLGFDLRVTILGHVQRGGTPSAFDRILASRFGEAAVQALDEGASGVLIGLISDKIARTPLEEVNSQRKTVDPKVVGLARVLAK